MKVKKTIVLLPGDGIGPEVTRAAATVLRECAQEFHHEFDLHEFPVGGAAIDAAGTPLPNETLDACRKADAVFLGAVGGATWDALPVGKRPESGLLGLRKGMGLYVNVRPVKVLEEKRLIRSFQVGKSRVFRRIFSFPEFPWHESERALEQVDVSKAIDGSFAEAAVRKLGAY